MPTDLNIIVHRHSLFTDLTYISVKIALNKRKMYKKFAST